MTRAAWASWWARPLQAAVIGAGVAMTPALAEDQATPAAAAAQEPAPATQTAAAPTAAATATDDDAEALEPDEIDALVAPVALYPDPILQASVSPLELVQAARFLDKHAKDSSLQPDPGWDESTRALLNYPTIIISMSGISTGPRLWARP